MIPNLAAMKFAILAALYGVLPEPPPIAPGPPVVPLTGERLPAAACLLVVETPV